jgi:hypothetical protein
MEIRNLMGFSMFPFQVHISQKQQIKNKFIEQIEIHSYPKVTT